MNTGFIRVLDYGKVHLLSFRLKGRNGRTEQHPAKSKGWRGTVSVFASSVPSRRRVMRLPATRDVWVYWECGGRADVSHVRDLSTGGIFIETTWRRTKGEVVRVHFLVQEGQISLDSVVAQAQPAQGLGLKFQLWPQKIFPNLVCCWNECARLFARRPRRANQERDED